MVGCVLLRKRRIVFVVVEGIEPKSPSRRMPSGAPGMFPVFGADGWRDPVVGVRAAG
jgi:hypothetical protein